MPIDAQMPVWDRRLWSAEPVHAPPAETYAAIRRVDFLRSPVIAVPNRARVAFDRTFRRVPAAAGPPRRVGFDELVAEGGGFHLLDERPGRDVVLGFVGRWWDRAYGRVEWSPGEFRGFDRPGFAVGAWGFAVLPYGTDSVLVTEVRVRCTDAEARRRFGRYWTLVGPFVAAMGRPVVRLVRKEAEGAATTTTGPAAAG